VNSEVENYCFMFSQIHYTSHFNKFINSLQTRSHENKT